MNSWFNIIKKPFRFKPDEDWKGVFEPLTNKVKVNLSHHGENVENDKRDISEIINTLGHEYAHLANEGELRIEKDKAFNQLMDLIHAAAQQAEKNKKDDAVMVNGISTNPSVVAVEEEIGRWWERFSEPIKKYVGFLFMDELFAYRSEGEYLTTIKSDLPHKFITNSDFYIKNLHKEIMYIVKRSINTQTVYPKITSFFIKASSGRLFNDIVFSIIRDEWNKLKSKF